MADDHTPANTDAAEAAYPAEAYEQIALPPLDGAYSWHDKKADFLAMAQRLQLSPDQAKGMVQSVTQHLRTASETWQAREQERTAWEAEERRQAEDRFWDLRKRQFDLNAKEQTELRRLSQRFGAQPARYARNGVRLHKGP